MTVPPADHPDLFVGAVCNNRYGSLRFFYAPETEAIPTGDFPYQFGAWKLHEIKSRTFGDSSRWVRIDQMLSGDLGVFPWKADPHTKMVEGDL